MATKEKQSKKFKVAHKRVSKNKWSITEKAQRKKVIQFLEEVIRDLKEADEGEENPYTVGEYKRSYGMNLRTKTELYQMAVEQHIPNRSKMSHEDLLHAIKSKTDGQQDRGLKQNVKQKLRDKSREELYKIAQKRSIRGRSEMKKEELLTVLQNKSK